MVDRRRRRGVRLRRHALARDNFVPFLRRFAGTAATARGVRGRGGARRRAGRSQWSRNGMKAAVLQQLLAGRDVADLDDTARAFADDVLRDHLRGEAVERADWHRTQGHRLVIVSASLAVYLRPDRRAPPVRRRARDRARGRRRRAAHRRHGRRRTCAARRRRAGSTSGSPAPTPFVWAYGDSSATRSSGPGPIAPSGSVAAPTAARPDAEPSGRREHTGHVQE